MKKINNEEILDRIYDLADSMGMRINDFMAKLEEDYGEKLPDLDGLPTEIAEELIGARANKKEQKRQERLRQSEADAEEEIKKFRELFPDVPAEDIPDEVWLEVENGTTLSAAYALYLISQENLNKYAEDVNDRNSRMGAKAVSDGSTEPVFTKELVEKMSDKDVKSNYKGILNAMKNWKFN